MSYDPKSLKAEEFISHEEIQETLAYAEANKHNEALIDQILEKAKLRKGLTHRELLYCWTATSRRKTRRSTNWLNRLKRISTGTGLLCLRPFICPITVSTAVYTVLITGKTSI